MKILTIETNSAGKKVFYSRETKLTEGHIVIWPKYHTQTEKSQPGDCKCCTTGKQNQAAGPDHRPGLVKGGLLKVVKRSSHNVIQKDS